MSRNFASLQIGDKAGVSKKITSELIFAFAELSEDRNPLHLDEEFAKNTRFGQRIAHGMISGALLSAVHTQYPGDGAVYMSQSLKFRAPVHVDDTLTAWTELKEKITDKKRLLTRDWVVNQRGEIVVEGEALLFFDK